MADTLKFGPEWLRVLSHGSNVTSPPSSPGLTKYKLAEHRYGREEMLVLYNKDLCQKPDVLDEFSTITLDKCQFPLAFLPFSEEEQRNWSRSVNSDVVVRLAGRGSNPPGVTGPRPGGTAIGRGASVDRGRGRGRGSFYSRNISDEPGLDVLRDRDPGLRHNRNFDRGHILHDRNQPWDDKERKFEKSFNPRGGGVEENGTLATRKENWRSEREEPDDDSGWRNNKTKTDKWSRTNWRNHPDEKSGDYGSNSRHDPRSFVKGNRFYENHGDRDQLPEWSKEDDFEWVGTFDSSGAFRENQDRLKENEEKTKNEERSNRNMSKEGSREEELKTGKNSPVHNTQNNKSQNSKANDQHWDVGGEDDERTQSQIVSSSSSSLSSTVSSSDSNNRETADQSVSCSDQNLDQNSNISVPKTDISVEREFNNQNFSESKSPVVNRLRPLEADFDHLQKAAENMMEKWTAEEEARTSPASQNPVHMTQSPQDKITTVPLQHENALKWLYQDPQGEIQGPFLSEEMSEWLNAGYFSMNLFVRRGCDDKFLQLGELMKMWGACPFSCAQQPPPIKMSNPAKETTTPVHTPENGVPSSHQEEQLRMLQQLHPYQVIQQQLLQEQQALLRQQIQVMSQLKQTEGFDLLTPQQQQQLIIQYLLAQQIQQRSSQSVPEGQGTLSHDSMQQFLSKVATAHHPPAGLWPGVPRQAPSVWDMDSRSQSDPVQQNTAAIISNIEELQRREKERVAKEQREQEERRLDESERLRKAEEEKQLEAQRQEEIRRKHEEEIIRQEEERRRNEELRRQEEERQRLEELRKKKEEEEKKQKEKEQMRRLEELRRKEELRKKEELRRQEELKIQEELRRQEELRQEELRRLEELKNKEEERKMIEMERQREFERIQEIERHEELEKKKEMEREFEEKQQALIKLQEQQGNKMQASVWGGSNSYGSNVAPSLAEIQKLQEEREQRERLERHKLMVQQQQQLAALQQQQQQIKANMTWATSTQRKSKDSQIKSLAEIQKEEEEHVSKQQREQAKQQKVVISNLPLNAAGVWGNASNQLTWNPAETEQSDDMSGFWDEPKKKAPAHKKSTDPSFPTLGNQPKAQKKTNSQNNKTKSRSKKEEENVLKLFESKSAKQDDFTLWCMKALSNQNHSVDVPTFIGFLKDIESPYEVQDYVKSFLGDSKEAKDFAKQFLERRSKQRNHINTQQEENMWGPAPAIMPNQNKSSNHDGDNGKNGNAAKKKKKGRMQKLDSSVLGFTVHADPTRINVGEIDHGDVLLSK